MIKKYFNNTNPIVLVFNESKIDMDSINELIRKIQYEKVEDKITFNECYEGLKVEWYPRLEKNSINQYEYIYRKFKPLYDKYICDLTLKNLQDTINPYLFNNGIKQKMKIILHKIFAYAEKYDYIEKTTPNLLI